ncbi:MAG TPA: PDZ domain-containing protein [Thermoanaerobaculia bacterium]|nr:PDZ domain-containing protein [Thermoanaerobaculia bacterium]
MVRYQLSWRNPNEHLYDVAVTFVAPVDDPLLHLPAWRPGRYTIQNFAANVREWSANMRKVAKSAWRVAAKAGEQVTVRYRYYAGVLDAGSSFLDESEAYFNGSNLFMWVDGLRSEPAMLAVEAPEAWRVETQLPSVHPHAFEGRDYDHLIDSPAIAAASIIHHAFEEADCSVHAVFLASEGIETGLFVEPLRAIVRTQAELFGGLPCSEYRFLYHVGDRWHGVEHEDSCSIIVRRGGLVGARPGDEGFDHLLSISSHELFHVWNVKRIVPARFVPYDYSAETPTRLLWAMEGITSYYGDLTLLRAGIWDAARYLRHLQHEIELLESSPGRHHLSLAQASFDGWLQDQIHDKSNAWVSFYNKGEIVAALLDLEIRRRSAKSLDDVMRHLWREYGEERQGLEEDAIERAVARVTGEDFTEFFARYVDGTEPLPYAELFDSAGVTYESQPRDLGFGARVRSSDGALLIDSVTRGGTAMEAGLLPGDELIAIDATRTRTEADVQRLFRGVVPGVQEVEIVFARAGVVQHRRVVARPDGSVTVSLTLREGLEYGPAYADVAPGTRIAAHG